jgi:hypothetical protein
MKSRIFAVLAAVVVVLFMLKNTEGYYPWPTKVNPSEQANDYYLENLLRANGYEGKYIEPTNTNLQESRRLNATLRATGYAEIPMTQEIRPMSTALTMPPAPPPVAIPPPPKPRQRPRAVVVPAREDYSYPIILLLSVALVGGISLYMLLR